MGSRPLGLWAQNGSGDSGGRWGPHHPLQRTGDARSLVQKLTVFQLLAEPLQRVQRLVQLHRHGHFGQVLPNVVAQNAPHANATGVGTRRWQVGPPFGPGFPTTFENRP